MKSPRLSRRSSSLFALASLSLLAAAGCDQDDPGSGSGDAGHVAFVASACGAPVCDLDLGVAAGASVQLALTALDATEVGALRIEVADPSIAEAYELGGGVELIAWRAGTVELRAVDAAGAVIDTATIAIVQPDRLAITVDGGGVQGPMVASGYDTMYWIPVATEVEVAVTALAGDAALIGAGFFGASLSPELAAVIPWADWRDDGAFTFAMPDGGHTLAFDLPGAATRVRLAAY